MRYAKLCFLISAVGVACFAISSCLTETDESKSVTTLPTKLESEPEYPYDEFVDDENQACGLPGSAPTHQSQLPDGTYIEVVVPVLCSEEYRFNPGEEIEVPSEHENILEVGPVETIQTVE